MKKPSQIEAPVAKPKKRDRASSEARLIKAAEETFSKYGFAGTTTKLIAQKAKVNEALIARYFDGKMGLLFAVIKAHIQEFKGELPYPPKATLREEIAAYTRLKFESHCAHGEDFFKIVLSQTLVDAKFAKRFRAEIPISTNLFVLDRLEKLATQGKVRSGLHLPDFVDALDRQIMAVLLFDRLMIGKPDREVERLIETTIEYFANVGQFI